MIQNNDGSDLFKTTIPVSNDILNVVSEEDEVNGLYDDDTFDTMYGIYDDDYYDEEYCDGAECNTHTTNANNKKDMNDDGISAMTYDVATAATTSNSNDVRVVKEVKTKAVEENAQTSLFSTRNCRTIQVSACMALVIAIIILLIGIVTAIVVSSTRRETATNRYSPTLTPSSWSTMPPSNQFRCFRSSNELRTSVELYLTKDDISVKEKYGYTIGEWCVDSIQDFSNLFQSNGDGTGFGDVIFDFFFERGAYNFNEDISNWNTSSAVDMSFMFHGAKQFNQDISRWDVSKVKNMSHMFMNAKRI